MSEYDRTVQLGIHITPNGQSPPPLAEVQKASHRFGRPAIDFTCRFDPELGTAVVVGTYQTRQMSCLLNADPLFKQFDNQALGRLIIEILVPQFAKHMPYADLGRALREAMAKARNCKTGTVIMWVDERLDGDRSVIYSHTTEVT